MPPYSKQTWTNGGPGAVNDVRLNHMEDGIEAAMPKFTTAGITPVIDAYNTTNRSIGNAGNIFTFPGLTAGWLDTIDTEDTDFVDMSTTGVLTVIQDAWLDLLFDVVLAPAGATSGLFGVVISVSGTAFGSSAARGARTTKSALVPLADAGSEISAQCGMFAWFPAGAVLTPGIHQSSGSSKNATSIAWVGAAYA